MSEDVKYTSIDLSAFHRSMAIFLIGSLVPLVVVWLAFALLAKECRSDFMIECLTSGLFTALLLVVPSTATLSYLIAIGKISKIIEAWFFVVFFSPVASFAIFVLIEPATKAFLPFVFFAIPATALMSLAVLPVSWKLTSRWHP